MDKQWPKRPVIYEINTWAWLNDLSMRYRRPVTLGDVPPEKWDEIASLYVDAVWLMGVWERSPMGIQISNSNPVLLAEFLRTLPDFTFDDNIGSAYCVRRYVVDRHLGGPEGLAVAREMLAQRGLRLILDFVPNHVAHDNPWTIEHPEYFVLGTIQDLIRSPGAFFNAGRAVIADGRDPYFPPWQDVAQLNAFHPGYRQASIQVLSSIADQCDGVRCDMAMLLLSDIFIFTWGERAGVRPQREYWDEVINGVKAQHPYFMLMAEVYWDLEWDLQHHGFDYCYDKRLYDRMRHDGAQPIRQHLKAGLEYQDRLVRFIENHDEPRAASIFPLPKECAYMAAIMTLPGAKLIYDGQIEGRSIRLPVFLARRPDEPVNLDLLMFYRRLLTVVGKSGFNKGDWKLCECSGWPDNKSYLNLAAWGIRDGGSRRLAVINMSNYPSQGRVHLPWADIAGRSWRLVDIFNDIMYERSGDEIQNMGLYIELPAWRFNLLIFE